MERKKRNKFFFIVLILVFSFIILLASLYFISLTVLDKKDIPVILKIGNISAIRVENESLDFGMVTYDSSAQKRIELKNNYNLPVSVFFNCKGDACNFLVYESLIFLNPLESKQIYFSTITFTNETYGDYSGQMKVEFRKAVK